MILPVIWKDFWPCASIIDPTDKTRNAAAAISLENLSRMKFCSRLYLNGKLPEYSKSYEKKRKDATDRGTNLRIFRIKKPAITDDILYPAAYHSGTDDCRISFLKDFPG